MVKYDKIGIITLEESAHAYFKSVINSLKSKGLIFTHQKLVLIMLELTVDFFELDIKISKEDHGAIILLKESIYYKFLSIKQSLKIKGFSFSNSEFLNIMLDHIIDKYVLERILPIHERERKRYRPQVRFRIDKNNIKD